ncbi:GH25 family lysozyme [Lacticaseibacillus mingshuiensis]|uniref:GH25 family lysozyme n=1 Tax=Lacticaseibacillus mingshuiensis TaxID=2799574 RepID=UPI00194E542B|nr:GH25 family lysozyme [Lacticaseibacillus mingshuiensis]
MTLKIVDLSSNNPNWKEQIKGTDGAIIKATQGTGYVNPLCNAQYAGVKKAGGVLGLYHYAGGDDPNKEAQYFIAQIKNYVGTATLWLDWESNQNSAWGNNAWGKTFATEVHRLTGVWPGVYVQASSIAQVASMAANSALWLAGYPTNEASWSVPDFIYSTGAWKDVTIWQFTSGGGLDRNIAYLDKAGWEKLVNGSDTVKVTTPGKPSTPKPSKPAASKSAAKPAAKAVNVMYGFHQLGGGWLSEVTNFGSGDNGYAGVPNKPNDYFYAKVSRGSLKFRVHTVKSGWLSWITKCNKADLINGCAGIKGEAIDAVELIYTTPAGEPYQQAYYRSQTTKRAGYLGVVCDDGKSLPAFKDTYAGIIGEPMDRLQVKVAAANPF